jgi:hypothetical protein
MRAIHAALTRGARSHDRHCATIAKLPANVKLVIDREPDKPLRVPRISRPKDAQCSGHKGNAISYPRQLRQVREIQNKRFQPLARCPYIYIRAERA